MLITPQHVTARDPVIDSISRVISGAEPVVTKLAHGIYQISHFNGEYEFVGITNTWPDLGTNYEFNCYGVCDSVENLLDKLGAVLATPDRNFFVTMVRVNRNPSNKGNGGGWRWHKWGPYIGSFNSQCEYLDDEEGIDGVYCYHIYEVAP